MTSSELKELVKAHFSLVEKTEVITEEKFGELKDINGAFTIKFPGDSIQVGDKVTVITAEGQEMDAPNGTHELEDGTKIRTEGSVVEEIYGADGEKELSAVEMATEEEVADVVEDIVEEVKEDMEEEPAVSLEEVVSEIVDALKEEMGKMKEKMEALEVKVEAIEGLPAAEATIVKPEMSSAKPKFSTFNVETAANADVIKMAIANYKKYKK